MKRDFGEDREPSGIYSFGESIEVLKSNINDAIKLYYEELGKPIPKYDFELVMDLQEFFKINDGK